MISIDVLVKKFPDCLDGYNNLLETRGKNTSFKKLVDVEPKESNRSNCRLKFSDWKKNWNNVSFVINKKELMKNYGFNFFEAKDGTEWAWHYTNKADAGNKRIGGWWNEGLKVRLLAMWGLDFDYFEDGSWGHGQQTYMVEMPIEHFKIISEVLKKDQGSGNHWDEIEQVRSLLTTGEFLPDSE